MDRLTISKSAAKAFLEKIKEKEYVPPVSFLFKSANGYTGVDNSRHNLQVKEFSKKQECIDWLEESYSKRLRESEGFMPRLREWMTIRNLMDADIVSNITKGHAGIRYNLYRGENINAKLVRTVYNPTLDTMTFVFTTPATLKAHEPGYQPDIVDPYSNFTRKTNPGHSYTMMIQILDFLKWLKGTRPSTAGDITWQEIKAVLDVAYVKVWCNCLRGNTNIKLLDGRTLTVKEMAEEFKTNKDLWVYSTDEHGNFKPGKVTDVVETGKTTEFIKITLDNGKYIETTPDHLYMMRDGSYKSACDLQIGESLMPLYFDEGTYNNGYERVKHNYGDYGYHSTYKEVAAEVFGADQFEEAKRNDPKNTCAIHHIDYNKKNNNPSNLKLMGRMAHYMFHANFIKDRMQNDPEFVAKLRDGAKEFVKKLNANPTENMKKNWKKLGYEGSKWVRENSELHKDLTIEGIHNYYKNHPEIRVIRSEKLQDFYETESGLKKKEELRRSMKNRWANTEIRQKYMEGMRNQGPRPEGSGKKGSLAAKEKLANMTQEEKDLRYKNKIITTYKKILKKMKDLGMNLTWENMRNFDCKHPRKLSKHFTSFEEMLEYAGYKNFNHKIVNIEYIQTEEEPLYDISVDKWNNFYVDAGVVLHNCLSFHFFGKNYRASQFDASLFPTNIPDNKMRSVYGEYDLLCKHLANLMLPNSIQFFLPQMASASQKELRRQGLI